MFNFIKWLISKYKSEQALQSTETEVKEINCEESVNLPAETEGHEIVPDYKDVNKIVLKSPDSSELTEFLKTFPSTIEHKDYRVLSASNLKNLAGSPISGILQGTAVKALAGNGLYTATVAPELLMRYSNGTIASMIKEGGKFAAHAGFTAAEAAVFAPMIVFQVLSIITSQYYLNGINKQLTAIQNSLDRLKNLNYSEDEGKLFSIQETISNILTSKQPLREDISIISACRKESLEIAAKYLSMLNKQFAPEKTKIHSDEKKRLDEIKDEINKTDGEFYMNMAYTAYSLSSMSDVALLYTLTYCNNKEDYHLRIQDLIQKMDLTWNEHEKNYIDASSKFYSSFDTLINKYKEKWPYDYENDYELIQKLNEFDNHKKERIEMIKKSPSVELKNELKNYLETPRDVLMCFDENGQQYILEATE